MSAYWCADDAEGKCIAEGYHADWPVTKEAAKPKWDTAGHSLESRRRLVSMDIYQELRKLVPDGGEIPWDQVPEWIQKASAFERTPAKICISF